MRSCRRWTEIELEYLRDKWGVITIPKIARNLNRTTNGVKLKAGRIGLLAHKDSREEIALNQIARALSNDDMKKYTRELWIRNGCPVVYRRSIKRPIAMVDLDKFWVWAENNKRLLNFARFEKNSLGVEPDWVDEKRKSDMANRKLEGKRWTSLEDSMLKTKLAAYKYTYEDLVAIFGRSEKAIYKRMYKLKIKNRPIEKYKKSKWSDKEIETLMEMREKGISFEEISVYIKRSTLAVESKYREKRRCSGDYVYGKGRFWAREEIELLTKLSKEGYVANEIKEKMDRSYSAIFHKMKQLGYETKKS